MSKNYILEPEVPGGLGPRTQMDHSVHPPKVETLHFVFDGWLGDQLIESYPCYLITLGMAEMFTASAVTGFVLAEAEIETSEQFKRLYPKCALPSFKWLQIVGTPANSDIYLTLDNRLVCSQKTLDVVLATNPTGLEFREA